MRTICQDQVRGEEGEEEVEYNQGGGEGGESEERRGGDEEDGIRVCC